MHDIDFEEAHAIGGGFSFVNWIFSQVVTAGVSYAGHAALSGQVDYAGLAESQGSGYNMMGA